MIVATVSANSDEATVAKAIERYFNVALYLLVLTGFGALASTGGLDLPAVLLVAGALAVRGFQLLTRREFIIPERWTNSLTLIYVFVYLGDYFFVSRSFLGASVHLVLFTMVVRLFSLQRTRDHYMLAVLAFWLTILFSSFTLFSPLNPTGCVAVVIIALSASCAIFLILEMNEPDRGMTRISDAPLRQALAQIGQ